MSSVSRKFRITYAIQHQMFRSISTTSQIADVQIDNRHAIKLINYLYVNNRKKSNDKYSAIREALDIYSKIIEPPTFETVDTLLKLFFYFGLPHKYVSIWNDIETLSSDPEHQDGVICYAMLLKCCLECNEINTDDCLQVLSWIKHLDYELKIKESYIGKLIIHCGKQQNIEAVDFMYKLFLEQLFDCNPIFIKTTFINAYSICNKLQKAVDIFTDIDDTELNMVCIGSMMKRYIDHQCYIDALSLYENINEIKNEDIYQNEYCDSMALQACIHSDNYEKGKTIHESVDKKLYIKGKSELEMNDHVKHSLISLYGHFGDVEEAKRLFESMRNNHANVIALNSMMNAYLKNEDNESALDLYKHALETNELSHVLAITACINTNNFIFGRTMYSQIKIKNYDIKLKNILIDFFGRCSDVHRAKRIFESMNERRLSTETVGLMMRAYIDNGHNEDGLQLYDDVINDGKDRYIGCALNNLCHSIAIKGAMNMGNYDKCNEIIDVNRIVDATYFEDGNTDDLELKNVVIAYYECCDDIESSLKRINLM